MKKILLFLLLSLSFFGFSQDVKYGVRGGYTISNLDFDTASSVANKHRNSLYVGFFSNIGLGKIVSIVPEIQFSAEGAKDENLNLDYIQAPILFRFRLSEKVHIGAGPQVGWKVYKFKDGLKEMAYSGVAALEYKLTLMLFADLRYTYGFSNIFDDDLGVSAKNRNIQIGVGYKF
ncbi:porin family protein [Mariniflexile sp.]